MGFIKLLFLLFISSSIFAYTPGKWSPLDKYIMGLETFGPVGEEVKSKDGKLLYTAEYEYDEKGRLVKEKFKNSKGEPDGETVYTYEKNKISMEDLYSSRGLEERKVFKYSTNNELKEIIVYSNDGKETLKYKVLAILNGMITDGEIRWVKDKEVEFFSMRKDSTNAKLYNQEILDDKKKFIAIVRYFFDEQGRLIKRENDQPQNRKMSEIKYDSESKVTEYSFSIFQENDWLLQKTHTLKYGNAKPKALPSP
jgi:hypothetical protein